MNETNDLLQINIEGWITQVQLPRDNQNTHVLAMLHGWTGDEHSMELFGRNVPANYLVLFPRGFISTPTTGFGWWPVNDEHPVDQFTIQFVCQQLHQAFQNWLAALEIKVDKIDLVGFSQGGALSLAYSVFYPTQVNKVGCLAGFLPESMSSLLNSNLLPYKNFFIAHGTLDEMVPVERARRSARLLENAGAQVEYCESEIGHRLSASCFRQFTQFLKR